MPATPIPRRRSSTPSRHSNGDLLSVDQAADYLNINERFVRRLINERRLPFVTVGSLVPARRSALDQWLAAAEVPAVRPTRGSHIR